MTSVEAPLSSDAYWGRVATAAGIGAVLVAVAYLMFRAAGVGLELETRGNQWVNVGICQLLSNPFSETDYTTNDLPSITLALAISQAFGLSLLGGVVGFLIRLIERPSVWYRWTALGVYLGLGGMVLLQDGSPMAKLGLWVLHSLVVWPALHWVEPALGRLEITR